MADKESASKRACVMTIRFDSDLKKAVNKSAKERRLKPSTFVREVLKKYMNYQEPPVV